MKKIILIAFVLISIQTLAQETRMRPYTEVELKRTTQVCNWLKAAVPLQMADCKATIRDCSDYTDLAVQAQDGKYFTAVDSKNRLVVNDYFFRVTFKRNDADDNNDVQMTSMKNAISEIQKGEAADKTYVAQQFGIYNKIENKKETTLELAANRMATRDIYYHKSITPKKIALPIPSSYAMIYAGGDAAVLNEYGNATEQLITDVKGDMAVIVIGKKAATVQLNWDGVDKTKVETITYHDVTPIAVASNGETTPPTEIQNVEILIKGDKENIEALIKQINWSALQSLIGK